MSLVYYHVWFDLSCSVLAPRIAISLCTACSPIAERYADRSLPGGTTKIDRRRSISVVGIRLREKSIVSGRLREKKGRRRRRREEEKKKSIHTSYPRVFLAHALSPPTRCPRLQVALAPSSLAGDSFPTRGDGMSPRAGRKIEATSP
ncbi:hypothetical protein BHE74_00048643, partial [Ensete ventricosum]